MTPIESEDLEHPPTVLLDDPTATARAAVDGAPQPYAVVLDEAGGLHGWVSRRHLDGDGAVGQRLHRFDETVELGDSLRRGLAEIVQHDAGWLPVLEDERYVGVLTPDAVYAALRRTVPADAREEAAEPV